MSWLDSHMQLTFNPVSPNTSCLLPSSDRRFQDVASFSDEVATKLSVSFSWESRSLLLGLFQMSLLLRNTDGVWETKGFIMKCKVQYFDFHAGLKLSSCCGVTRSGSKRCDKLSDTTTSNYTSVSDNVTELYPFWCELQLIQLWQPSLISLNLKVNQTQLHI